MAPKRESPGSIRGFMKAGFGLGLGSMMAAVLYIAVGAALFVPGFIIVAKQNKKPKEERSMPLLVTGFVLMGLGMIVGLGFGAGPFFGALAENL
jgi:uncharacterized membrane protein HdeD (DUF308 family)